MSEKHSTTALPADEQRLLDTALLESDQLLVRSLHDDQQRQRRRKVWLSVFLLGGVAMTTITLALLMGWFASSGQVTADPRASGGLTEAEWQERLLAVHENDSWLDGAKIGMELVKIPGDFPYKLLADNWQDMSINARQQILKGFTPGMMGNKILHHHFFNVMDLGMSDPNQEVRDYAANYLEMQGLPDFSHDPKGYAEWLRHNKNRPAQQIVEMAKAEPKSGHDAIDNDPEFKKAWQSFFARNYVESEKLFRAIVQRSPDNPHVNNGLGWSLINQKRYAEAKPWIEQAIASNDEHWGALSGLGVILKSEGDIDGAVEVWERIAESVKGPNDATANLADVAMDRKEYGKAIVHYKKLLLWFPDHDNVRAKLAEAEAGASIAEPAADKETQSSTAQDEFAEWRSQLTEAGEDSRWFVGVNFGKTLSELPGDEAFQILEPCWAQIADSVRPQILKGFTPGMKKTPGINNRFFDVMHLGYTDPDETVREFATTYINAITLSRLADKPTEYEAWKQTWRGQTADVIAIEQCKTQIEAMKTLKEYDIPDAMQRLSAAANDLREFKAMQKVAIESGLYEIIDSWVEEDLVSTDSGEYQHLLSNVPRPEGPAKQD